MRRCRYRKRSVRYLACQPAVHALIDTAIERSGLNADEFAVYPTLAAGDGVTLTELAQWMAAPMTTVSSYVKRFERRCQVERVHNPDDRRSYRLQLTAAGRDVHRAAGAADGRDPRRTRTSPDWTPIGQDR